MVTVLSDIPTAHGGTSHVTIHDLPLPGNIVWYAADVALPSGQHLEWRFGYTHLHARKEAEEDRVVTPETFTQLVRDLVRQRLQREPLRDYPDLVFGVNRPLPPRASVCQILSRMITLALFFRCHSSRTWPKSTMACCLDTDPRGLWKTFDASGMKSLGKRNGRWTKKMAK